MNEQQTLCIHTNGVLYILFGVVYNVRTPKHQQNVIIESEFYFYSIFLINVTHISSEHTHTYTASHPLHRAHRNASRTYRTCVVCMCMEELSLLNHKAYKRILFYFILYKFNLLSRLFSNFMLFTYFSVATLPTYLRLLPSF